MIDTQWDNTEQTILRWDMSGKWTWDEFYTTLEIANQEVNAGGRKIVAILNPIDEITRGGYAPSNTLSHFTTVSQRTSPLLLLTIIVTIAPIGRMLVNTALQLRRDLRGHFLAIDSLEHARNAARERLAKE